MSSPFFATHRRLNNYSLRDHTLRPGVSNSIDHGFGGRYVPPVQTPSYRSSYVPALSNHTPVMAPVVPPLAFPVDPRRSSWAARDARVWPTPTFIPGPPEFHYSATRHSYPNTPLWETGTNPPEPFGASAPFRIHPHITPHPNNPTVPQLQWDIIHQPDLATRLTARGCIVPADLGQPAVDPHVETVRVASDHPTLMVWMQRWGPIRIEKPDITIRDMLDAIYNYFQHPMTPEDVEFANATPQNGHNLTLAAHQRIRDSYELYAVAAVGVFKRADVMGGHRRFQGLRPVACRGNARKLCLSILPGPVPRVQ